LPETLFNEAIHKNISEYAHQLEYETGSEQCVGRNPEIVNHEAEHTAENEYGSAIFK